MNRAPRHGDTGHNSFPRPPPAPAPGGPSSAVPPAGRPAWPSDRTRVRL